MRLSILDQAPISAGRTPADALREAAELAQAAERLGYARYWLAEHHGLGGLASTTPEVMLGMLGALTSRIRLGAGAILLPYYKPYKVAETFRLLETLFPGRIDLGVARSPGGSAEMSLALADRYLERALRMPEDFAELMRYLGGEVPGQPSDTDAGAATPALASPRDLAAPGPLPWVLGTSVKSARLAAAHGTGYAYGHFMNEENADEAIAAYRDGFVPSGPDAEPYVVLAVTALCAPTQAAAEELALSGYAWRLLAGKGEGGRGIPAPAAAARQLGAAETARWRSALADSGAACGDPAAVSRALRRLRDRYGADELMIVSYAHDHRDRIASYELIAAAAGLAQ